MTRLGLEAVMSDLDRLAGWAAIRVVVFGLALSLVGCVAPTATATSLTAMTTESLISELRHSRDLDLSDDQIFRLHPDPKLTSRGQAAAEELVRRGVAALPTLLAHVEDRRQSGKIMHPFPGPDFVEFTDNYWSRGSTTPAPPILEPPPAGSCARAAYDSLPGSPYMIAAEIDAAKARAEEDARIAEEEKNAANGNTLRLHSAGDIVMPSCYLSYSRPEHPPIQGDYSVKIGDLCFVLIGKIVNRPLSLGGWVPSTLYEINAATEMPTLAKWVRKDWAGLTVQQHREVLLADLRLGQNIARPPWYTEEEDPESRRYPALLRLRFYYPADYAALKGEDLKLKLEFEKDEREHAELD